VILLLLFEEGILYNQNLLEIQRDTAQIELEFRSRYLILS